ncbi:MAG TPA: hypothetical protein PKG96_00425 [Bacilli bacterium]|jgi:hypothetical protein|nr:hypothetical protein [Acholeplasmataceae bacterium]HNZ78099.1 hypothetical protein [Bacilli bacterium]HOD60561.1 hypothetical protein [Bacilli bacterium]HOH61873.1 hypothetical protein [Bacilli bacterium]HPB49152.1 hypothetical protein [Bacilli bacterium]
MKRWFILVLFACLFFAGCRTMKGLQYDKIVAEHEVYHPDLNSYVLINAKPVLEKDTIKVKYAITIYANIVAGTGRYFNYYQVDWTTDTGKIDQYYHIFKEDARKRSYAQNFFPYNYVDGKQITKVDILYDYEYLLQEEKIAAKVQYSEEMMRLMPSELTDSKFVNSLENYQIELIALKRKTEAVNRFKLNIRFIDLEEASHIDFQSWIVTNDGDIYPFYGIYHYQIDNGDFISVGDEIIADIIDFKEMFCKIKYYHQDEVYQEYYKMNIVIGEES